MSYWNGKRALIVGGSAGLGRALADVLAEHGARVAIVARRQEPLDAAATVLKTRGGDVLTIAADVTKPGELKRVKDTVLSVWGGVEALMRDGRGLATGMCRPDLVIDGGRQVSDSTFPINTLVWANEVRAVEVYTQPSSVPAEFQTVKECGAIVVWTEITRR